MKFIDDAKLKFGVWNRERKERAEERKVRDAEPAGVTIPLSLVRSAKFAAWMAYFSLVYFLWLYTLDIARDRAASLHLTHVGGWIGDIQFYFPYIVGFAVVAVGIPYVAKIAIPTFMSLSWRGEFWAKLWALLIAAAVSLVVIAGTFTVQGDTIMERDRDAAVAVEGVQQEAAVLAAQIADVQHAMDERTRSESVYVRTAASMSPEAYDRFVEARRGDWQYDRLVSYRAVSEEMVTLNQRMSELRAQQARQTTVASVQGEVVTERTGWIADTLGWLEGVRAILLSLVMDIVCLIMPWIALRLEQARNRQVGMVGGIPQHPWMLTNQQETTRANRDPLRRAAQDVAEAMVEGGADPRFAADMARSAASSGVTNEEVYDAETGEKLVFRKATWAKPPKKREKTRIEVPPGPPLPDETGVATDGGKRTAVTLGGAMEVPESVGELTPNLSNSPERADDQESGADNSEAAKGEEVEPHQPVDDQFVQTQPPEVSEQELDEPAVDAMELELKIEAESGDDLTDENVNRHDEADSGEGHRDVAPEASAGDDLIAADEHARDEGEQGEQLPENHHEPQERTEPETDPSRMIAAE